MGAASGGGDLVPRGGKVGGGGAGTSSWRLRGANRSNCWKVDGRVSWGRSCHVRQRTGSSMATGGTICRRVIVQLLRQRRKISDARKNNDVPCPSESSDPKRQVSVSKNVAIARFSDSVKRGTSGNFRFRWSHFLGRTDAHYGARSMYLASRSAECCSDIVERQSRL